MSKPYDYLVVGSGLSALTFSALIAKRGYSVKILEAHEHFGGYGHTFTFGDYSFNAQLHYAFSCGEDAIVGQFLRQLNLQDEVRFNLLNAQGYDRVFCDEKQLNIPYGLDNLQENMRSLFPEAKQSIQQFVDILRDFREVSGRFPNHFRQGYRLVPVIPEISRLWKYRSATLQEVFDAVRLPKILQTLVSGQLVDLMLPPEKVSFLIWASLFNAYNLGAYYPEKHFSYYIEKVIEKIKTYGGELVSNEEVTSFIREGKRITGVKSRSVDPKLGLPYGLEKEYFGKTIICNFDPKAAAEMIGFDQFSPSIRRKLDYDYSPSSFALYGIVEGLDLADYGFGDWNVWHCQPDHNQAFRDMHDYADYSKPYFGVNCRSLHTRDRSNVRRENAQVFQMLTVGNYDYWKSLKLNSHIAYNKKKKEVLDHLLDCVEEHYVPNIREHLTFKMTGSPTTNERYAWAPKGGSYGVNLTPHNFALGNKLGFETSIPGLYFCSAAAGIAGFGGTALTGCALYEKLTGDYFT